MCTLFRSYHTLFKGFPALLLLFILLPLASLSCTSNNEVDGSMIFAPGPNGDFSSIPAACRSNSLCQGDLARYCPGEAREIIFDCTEVDTLCIQGRGCVACTPGQQSCDGNTVISCSVDGLSKTELETCPGECMNGRCVDACSLAVEQRSYQGCEYWPTPISNEVSTDFTYAVGVVNVNAEPLNVNITRGGNPVTSRPVPPGALEVIELPWIQELRSVGREFGIPQPSARVPSGAYHLTSDLPVIVYQFSPLEYQISRDCSDEEPESIDGECYSFTNDASLLLPTHAMDQEYLVISYPALAVEIPGTGIATSPSSFQVVGVKEGQTSVNITFSAKTASSSNQGLRSYQAGESAQFVIGQGEVLQFLSAPVEQCENRQQTAVGFNHCEVGEAGDLTGTSISSDQPVEVFGSHTCAFVPYNVFACDHLEESIFPIASWGRSAVVPKVQPLINEPTILKIISGSDGNQISFAPEIRPTLELNAGEYIEFEVREGVIITGTGSLQVAQLLVGQNYSSQETVGGYGDPSLSLIPPSDQFRKDYTILAPETYAIHFINLAFRQGTSITLDGQAIEEGEAIGNSGWRQASVEVSGGVHQLEGTGPFGVWVYGFGSYTSYMYPGGLDLKVINDVR